MPLSLRPHPPPSIAGRAGRRRSGGQTIAREVVSGTPANPGLKDPGSKDPARWSLLLGLGVLALGIVLELAAVLRINSGHFTYTLDDPYIHLALAQRIRDGHYGINPGEPAAPSSSVLWPFLLAPAARLGGFVFLPFVLCVLAAGATVAVYHRALLESIGSGGSRPRPALLALLLVLLVLATNLIGLPFTGMEHSLQILLVSLIALGLVREAGTGRVPRWLVPAIALAPTIRYESLAISAAAILYLWLRGHRRLSGVAAIATAAPIGLFSAYLAHLGLGLLPTSVVAKEHMLSSPGLAAGALANVRTSLRDPTGVLLALAAAWMLGLALLSSRSAAEKALAGSVALGAALHLIAGAYGAYHRWEIYIVAVVALTLLYLERRVLSEALAHGSPVLTAGVALLWCVALAGRYLFGLGTVPVAANNIYEQQYQMHRFVVNQERRAVAVNDLGCVSFDNREYVLDLLGLGSPSLEVPPGGVPRIDRLEQSVAEHGIETAMVYEEWFDSFPPSWRKVGELRLSRPKITPAWERVSFYATSEALYPRVRERVAAFQASLPPGDRFVFTR